MSVGKDNTYGHLNAGTLARLTAAGAKVYRTDDNGMATVTTHGVNWVVNLEK